jgi:uridine kinase
MEITGPDGKGKSVHPGTTLMALAREYQSRFPAPIALATVDGRATPLQLCPEEGSHVMFCDLSTEAGYRAYIATFQFALIVAMAKERPEVRLEVENTFGDGLYCAVKNKIFLSKYDLEDITRCMEELIRSQEPIEVKTIAKDDAWPYVNPRFYDDQAPLLEAVPKEYRINIYQLGGGECVLRKSAAAQSGLSAEIRTGVGGPWDPAPVWRQGPSGRIGTVSATEKTGRGVCPG